MKSKFRKNAIASLFIFLIMLQFISYSVAWSNKGKDDDENYGTHAWVADHAYQAVLKSVNNTPDSSKYSWIATYHEAYLKGTKAPDRPFVIVSGVNPFDYCDVLNHHNYYETEQTIIKDRASIRAQEEFEKAIVALKAGKFEQAAFYTGAMTHYLADISNYMHVMGKDSPLGSEDRDEHSEYESNMRRHTDNLTDSFFNITYQPVIKRDFDTAAYEAGRRIGWAAHQNAEWMNQNYQSVLGAYTATTEFELRTELLLNKAINEIASLIYTLGFYSESDIEKANTSFNYRSFMVIGTGGILALFIVALLITTIIRKRNN
jgi:hypothetical protein